MRMTPNHEANRHRMKDGLQGTNNSYGNNGAFVFRLKGAELRVIVSDGLGWDHVSVSLSDRCPTWEEMCHIKKVFFQGNEWVLQYHPAQDANVNCHEHCLHLWRPQAVDFPKPPAWMVGPDQRLAQSLRR